MDESVGRVIRALKTADQYDDTIFVFSSDNGGQCLYGGNNYPYRGRKFSLWQGGVRSAGFIAGPGIEPGKSYDNLFHVVDWMPTLLDAIGVKRYRDLIFSRICFSGPSGNLHRNNEMFFNCTHLKVGRIISTRWSISLECDSIW